MLPLFAHMWRIGVNRLFHGLPALVAAIPTFSKSFIPRLVFQDEAQGLATVFRGGHGAPSLPRQARRR